MTMSHVATEVVRYKDVEGRGRTWSGDIFFDYNILIKIVTIYFLVNKMAHFFQIANNSNLKLSVQKML